jgi:general stress protein CsbA
MTITLENTGQYKDFIEELLNKSEELESIQGDLVTFIRGIVKEYGNITVVPELLTIKLYYKEYVDNLIICEIDLVDMVIKGFYMDSKYRNRYIKNLKNNLTKFTASKKKLEKKLESKLMRKKKKEKLSLELQQTGFAIQHMKDYIEYFTHREETIVDVVWNINEKINNDTEIFPFFKITRQYEHLDLGE